MRVDEIFITISNLSEYTTSSYFVCLGFEEDSKLKVQSRLNNGIKHINSSTVFRGKLFWISSTFPEEKVS